MRFLLEADNNSLLSIKNQLEDKQKIRYSSLNDSKRLEFISKCVDRASNTKTFKQARGAVIKSIRDSNWNQDVINYLDNLDKQKITGSEVSLITDLIADGKISSDESWLYNDSLYDRDVSDALYTIKALTLASNPSLQNIKDDNGNSINKYFDEKNPLTVKDLEEGGKIKEAAEIQDIIASKEDPEKIKKFDKEEIKANKTMRDYLKQLAKEKQANVDVDQTLNQANEKIKEEIEQVLKTLNYGNQAEIDKAIDDAFEEGQTTEYLLNKILRDRG